MNFAAAFGNTWDLMRQNFLLFFTLAFAGIVAIKLVEALLFGVEFAAFGPRIDPGAAPDTLPFTSGVVLWLLLTQIFFSVLSAVVHLAAWDVMLGNHPRPAAYFARAGGLIMPLFFLSIVFGLAVGFGLLLFIIPGIYILGMFAIFVPVIVIEGRGWAALERCMELTVDNRWTIALAFIALGLGVILVSSLIGGLILGVAGTMGVALIWNTTASALMLTILAVFTTEVYAQLAGHHR